MFSFVLTQHPGMREAKSASAVGDHTFVQCGPPCGGLRVELLFHIFAQHADSNAQCESCRPGGRESFFCAAPAMCKYSRTCGKMSAFAPVSFFAIMCQFGDSHWQHVRTLK